MQHPTRLKGTFVPNEDYFFKQHLFHIISNLIFILLYFTWVSSSQDNPTGGSCHGRRVFLVPWWIVKLWFARNTFQVGHVKQCNPNFSDTDIFYLILNFHFLHLWMSTGEDGQPHITKFEFISKFFCLLYTSWPSSPSQKHVFYPHKILFEIHRVFGFFCFRILIFTDFIQSPIIFFWQRDLANPRPATDFPSQVP
jgi:hypothetical protein